MGAFLICAAIIAFVIFLIQRNHSKDVQLYREEEVKRKNAEELRIKQENLRLEQENLRIRQEEWQKGCDELIKIIEQANSVLVNLQNEIIQATNNLDDAENEFAEGAFAPFWDKIENAAACFSRYEQGLQQIKYLFESYKYKVKFIEHSPPPFNLNFKILPRVVDTTTRMNILVRYAQKDFQFSTIYEQRKTNQLLVAGFSSLGQALSEMSYRISDSIKSLSYSISDLAESSRENTQELMSGLESLKEQIQSDAEASRNHERIEREMLNNIQHRRKP